MQLIVVLYYTEFLLTHDWAELLTAEWAVLPVTVQQQYCPLYGEKYHNKKHPV